MPFYNCDRCPSYCCSYPRIQVEESDLIRLAKHFGLSYGAARKKFVRRGEEPNELILRHTADEIYGTACQFLDRTTRRCTIYEARPAICRTYPGDGRCGYYDFLSFERRAQDDPDHVPSTYNHPPSSPANPKASSDE
ncbi:MAG TPA: YkgJ family cysteine cluster protein [Thermoanaerobaculia bacterium]|nr:YkgJ family cysteine cluster protein [Thermoanaerobaculia bacterium]